MASLFYKETDLTTYKRNLLTVFKGGLSAGRGTRGNRRHPRGAVRAGGTGTSRTESWQPGAPGEKGFPVRSFSCPCAEKQSKGMPAIIPGNEAWPKLALAQDALFVNQAGSIPFHASACVSPSALQKAEVSTYIMSCL